MDHEESVESTEPYKLYGEIYNQRRRFRFFAGAFAVSMLWSRVDMLQGRSPLAEFAVSAVSLVKMVSSEVQMRNAQAALEEHDK